MARNKHPELTEARILDAADRLFQQKGYRNTSIQDIVDEAGGITRGAFYHHFESKEDCFDAVTAKRFRAEESFRVEGESGLEKIRNLVIRSVSSEVQVQVMRFSRDFFRSDEYIVNNLYGSVEQTARMMRPFVEEGIADGSLRCRHAQEAAELLLLLFNVYLNPVIFETDEEGFMRRLDQAGRMLRGAGVDIVNERVARAVREYYRSVNGG